MEINLKSKYSLVILEAKGEAAEEEPEPKSLKTKTKRKKSPLKRKEFMNEIKNDEIR